MEGMRMLHDHEKLTFPIAAGNVLNLIFVFDPVFESEQKIYFITLLSFLTDQLPAKAGFVPALRGFPAYHEAWQVKGWRSVPDAQKGVNTAW